MGTLARIQLILILPVVLLSVLLVGSSYNASWWAFVCDGGPLTITIT
ncbi:MAG: hypothetical protein IPG87_15160 [Saprospiraceae bacterium]|nr:hypothetical protein [Candidatus Vicinibacter affinis]